MKKMLIAGGVFVVAMFVLMDWMGQKGLRPDAAVGALKLDKKGAERSAAKMLVVLTEAKQCFVERRFGAAAAKIGEARSCMGLPMLNFADAEFRQHQTVRQWNDDTLRSFAGELAVLLPAVAEMNMPVFDFDGLRDCAAQLQHEGLKRAASAYCNAQYSALGGRAVVAAQFRGVPGDLRQYIHEILLRRVAPGGPTVVVIGGGDMVDALPGYAGTAKFELQVSTPQYSSPMRSEFATLTESLKLTITPDRRLATGSTWTGPTTISHSEKLSRRYSFSGETGEMDAEGRPITTRVGADEEHYAGSVEEFAAGWNRYFWKRFRPKIETLGDLGAKEPPYSARLIGLGLVTGMTSTNARLRPVGDLAVVFNDSEHRVSVFDPKAGTPLATIDLTQSLRVRWALAGETLMSVRDNTNRIELWDLRTGKLLGECEPKLDGRIIGLRTSREGPARALVLCTNDDREDCAAVVDLKTGIVVGPLLRTGDPTNPDARTIREIFFSSAETVFATEDGLTRFFVERFGEPLIVSRDQIRWRLQPDPRKKPPVAVRAERIPDGAIGAISAVDGSAHAYVAADGSFAVLDPGLKRLAPLPCADQPRDPGAALKWKLQHCSERVLWWPKLRRFCWLPEQGRSLAIYEY